MSDVIDAMVEGIKENIQQLKNNDAVHHPSHYCKGGVECIDAIRASMSHEAFKGYCKGNCMKYIYRYEDKGGIESLQKARVYLDWLILEVNRGES